MSARRLVVGRVLAGLLVGGALVLPFAGGYPLAYGLMLVSLMLIVWWLTDRPRLAELMEPAGIMMPLAVLLIAMALAATASEPRDLAYAGNFTMLALFPLLRAAMARLAHGDAARLVALAALAGTALAALIAVAQVAVLGFERAQGFGSDPIWAAQAALLTGFLALGGLDALPGRWRTVLLLGPALALVTVFLTGSRGPLVAAAPLLAVAVLAAPGHRLRLVAASAGAIVIAGLASVALQNDAGARIGAMLDSTLGVFSPAGTADPSVGGRVALYRAGWSAFLDAPVAGHGWAQRVSAAYGHVPGGEAAILAADPMMQGNHHLHADILDLGVGAGILGVAAYLLILAAPVAGALASPRDGQRPARIRGAAVLSAATLLCGLSYIMIGYEFPTTLFVVVAAILLGLCRDRAGPGPAEPAARAGD